jgi:hypothetical protein
MSIALTPAAGLEAIPLESPLSLFGPPHYVHTQIPAPLLLLEYVPGRLDKNYPADAEGFLVDKDDWYLERMLRYEDGSQCRIEVVGHPRLGLPTTYDWDFLLGLFRIADQGGVDLDTGRVLDPSYRGAIRAAARSESGQESVNAVKRAFARWGGVLVKTWTDISYASELSRLRLHGGYPIAPGGYPPRREIESNHHVLTYDVEKYLRGEVEHDMIEELRIDPVWLGQTAVGISAWIDVEVHNTLRSPTAKAIYQRMAVRVARGQRGEYVVRVPELLAEIGKKPSIRASTDLNEIRRALQALEQTGVLAEHRHRRIGRGEYEVALVPGDHLREAALLRGAGAADPVQTRRLLFHLGRFNISVSAARELIRSNPAQVVSALCRAYYLKLECGGRDGGRPIGNFAGWIVDAVRHEWSFHEPEYLAWVERMTRFAVQAPEPIPPQSAPPPFPAPPAAEAAPTAPAPDPLPEDLWGRVREQLQDQVPRPSFDIWLRPTWLLEVTGTEVRVGTENPFAAEWITDRWGETLERLLTEELARPVRLRLHCQPRQNPGEGESEGGAETSA